MGFRVNPIYNMTSLPIWTVDAFTSFPFSGNPAAVCLLEDDIPDSSKQKIAAEMNISETAFVTKEKGASFNSASKFGLRWFTPTTEVPLCGHATLAAATVIFREKENLSDLLTFSTRSGDLTAEREGNLIVLDLPSNPGTSLEFKGRKDLVDIISCGLSVKESVMSTSTGKLLVRLGDHVTREDLEMMDPDVEKLPQIQQNTVRGVIVTIGGKGTEYDFLSRYFAPWVGIKEDPVTGSAHTVLAPYWSAQLNKESMRGRQCSPRGGDLHLRLVGDRVKVAGNSTIVLSGRIRV